MCWGREGGRRSPLKIAYCMLRKVKEEECVEIAHEEIQREEDAHRAMCV